MDAANKVYLSDDVQGYRLIDGTIATCWAVNHPSRGLGWSKLAELTYFACGEALRVPPDFEESVVMPAAN